MTEQVDRLVDENRRLAKEVRELRARVAAFESSRWWRLHPRLKLSRRRTRERSRRVEAPVVEKAEVDEPTDAVARRFREAVAAGGHFREDWFTMHIPVWDRVLREFDGRPSNVLELGSFEGLSACFVLWRLPGARVTCVDTFVEYEGYGTDLEQVFESNVSLVDAARVRKLVGKTTKVLPDLLEANESFDLVYVDASHRALDVHVDAALSWQLLSTGGVAIFDDYGPVPSGEDPLLHPRPALEAFAALVADRSVILDEGRQLVLRKTG